MFRVAERNFTSAKSYQRDCDEQPIHSRGSRGDTKNNERAAVSEEIPARIQRGRVIAPHCGTRNPSKEMHRRREAWTQ
jgi:hypothetical protein